MLVHVRFQVHSNSVLFPNPFQWEVIIRKNNNPQRQRIGEKVLRKGSVQYHMTSYLSLKMYKLKEIH